MGIVLQGAGFNKVQVIKVYREITGVGLAEAKEAIDNLPIIIDVPDAWEAVNQFEQVGAVAYVEDNEKNSGNESLQDKGWKEEKEISDLRMNPDEVGSLKRNELLEVLGVILSITKGIDSCYNEIVKKNNEIDEVKRRAQEIREKRSGWVLIGALIGGLMFGIALISMGGLGFLFGLVAGFIVVMKFLSYLDIAINKNKREQEAEKLLNEELPILNEAIWQAQMEIKRIFDSEDGCWAREIVGNEMFNSESVLQLQEIVKSRRADTLKEALNKYDSTKHTQRMEEMQRAIQNASEVAAEESVKQTAYSKEIAKSSHQAATAAKASAYHTRQIDKNTRRFRKK